MPSSSNFNIYPGWFSVHLILLFGIWGTCMHPSVPHLCQTPEAFLHLQVPYALLLAGCIAISLLQPPFAFMKSWLKNHFGGHSPQIYSSFVASIPTFLLFFLGCNGHPTALHHGHGPPGHGLTLHGHFCSPRTAALDLVGLGPWGIQPLLMVYDGKSHLWMRTGATSRLRKPPTGV